MWNFDINFMTCAINYNHFRVLQDIVQRFCRLQRRASINFYAFNSNGNRGIACGLNNLQIIRDGEPLGSRASAESDFADFSEDEIITAFENMAKELVASKEDIITLCRDALIKVLDTTNDKEKAKKLKIELDQDYLELGQQLRSIGKTELGKNESYDNAFTAYEAKNQSLQELKARIADKDKRCFDALQFADRLEDITDISFSKDLWCSLIDHVNVPTGGEKSLIFHLRNGGAIDIVLDQ